MKKTQMLVLANSIIFLVACSEPVIDASTDSKMIESYEEIYKSLPDEKKEQFKFSYGSILYSYRTHRAYRKTDDTKEIIRKRIENAINGKNADQIIEEYTKVQRTRSLWAIQDIEKQIAKREEDKEQLARVKIDRYELYLAQDGMRDRMFLDAVILNDSKYKLSSAVFDIRVGSSFSHTLLPQKRSIYVEFPEGLEQGSNILRTIDLGHPTPQRYLPQGPILSEYSTSRIAGAGMDISANIYPAVSDLEKTLIDKRNKN